MPLLNGQKISQTDASKLMGVLCSSAEPELGGHSCELHCTRLLTLRCSTITPFGVPVEPEV